jgi:hypothetical protein
LTQQYHGVRDVLDRVPPKLVAGPDDLIVQDGQVTTGKAHDALQVEGLPRHGTLRLAGSLHRHPEGERIARLG